MLSTSQGVGSKSPATTQRRAFGERMRKPRPPKKSNDEREQGRSSESILAGVQNSSEEVLLTGSAFEAALKKLQTCKEVLVNDVQILQQSKDTLEANVLALQRKKRHLLKKNRVIGGKRQNGHG